METPKKINGIEIEYVGHSLGNYFVSSIELNKHLKKYPKLHDAILAHELKHTPTGFIQNLKNDLSYLGINSSELFLFMFKHPASFMQLLPCYYSRKHGFIYDLNLIILYCFTFCCFTSFIILFLIVS